MNTKPLLIALWLALALLGGGWCDTVQPAEKWGWTTGRVGFSFSAERAAEVRTASWSIGLRLGGRRASAAAPANSGGTRAAQSVALTFDLGRASDRTAGTAVTTPDVIDLDYKVIREKGDKGGTFASLTFLSDHDWKPAVFGLGYGYRHRGAGGLALEGALQTTKDSASGAPFHFGYRVGLGYQLRLVGNLRWQSEGRAQGAFGTSQEDQRYLENSIFYPLAGNLGLTTRHRLETPLAARHSRSLTQILLSYDLKP